MPNYESFLAHSSHNAFARTRDPTSWYSPHTMSPRDNRAAHHFGNDRSIIQAIYTRIAIDCAQQTIEHVYVDKEGQYVDTIYSGLNECISVSANVDQTGRQFIQDIVESMLDEGYVAVCPIDTEDPVNDYGSREIITIRVGRIAAWHPEHVDVELLNEKTGLKETVNFKKTEVAIIENPFYSVMNANNSILKRLVRKLNLIDVVDEQVGSGKLDMIISLPYATRSEVQKEKAKEIREDLERQIASSKFGIAFTEGTEKITQINKSLENNLLKSAEYLQNILYSQLGITEEILNGSADETTMANYMSRVIEPILMAIINEFKRKFLNKEERNSGESFIYHTDPFKLVPASAMADLADKLTRNEIFTSNEIRAKLGMKPSNDPNADTLLNKNINHPEDPNASAQNFVPEEAPIENEPYEPQYDQPPMEDYDSDPYVYDQQY